MRSLKIFAIVFPAVFIADQLTKWAILEYVIRPGWQTPKPFWTWAMDAPARLGPNTIEIFPFFNIVMVWNYGISFGILSSQSVYQPYILSAVSLIICGILFYWLLKEKRLGLMISFSVIIGGAMGNVADRLRFGAVADFFDFHIAGWHYPAFNIADSAIVLGVAYLLIDILFLNKPNKDEMVV